MLEVNFKEIEKKVLELSSSSEEERQAILERADREIPREMGEIAQEIVRDLCYDRSFCRRAGIGYNNITEKESRLVKTALASYLLDKREC